MTELPANIGSYRDRHGKVRWRYRKGKVTVQIPGQPGDADFTYAAEQAAAGLLKQKTLETSPRHQMVLGHFARDVVSRVKHRAREKDLPFSLTEDDVKRLMAKQGWRCAVSGIRFLAVRPSNKAFQPSLDRIEPRKGYVAGNVRIVCFIVNVAMSDWGEDPLLHLVKVMANRAANHTANVKASRRKILKTKDNLGSGSPGWEASFSKTNDL